MQKEEEVEKFPEHLSQIDLEWVVLEVMYVDLCMFGGAHTFGNWHK